VAFKTFADGSALPASDLNTYLMKQAVIVCTSGTRPSSPIEGMVIYETDTDKLQIYTTATTTWKPPWNLPWGCVGFATSTTSQGAFTATTDITGLTTTFTAVANRRYRTTANINLETSVSGDVAGANILYGASVASYGQIRLSAGGASEAIHLLGYFTTSGSVTVKVVAGRSGGTGVLITQHSGTSPVYLIVEDIGPSAAPS
jgi:hypothetical protein